MEKKLIIGMLNRAYNICSSWELFHKELDKIKEILISNGYPKGWIEDKINDFLNKKLQAKEETEENRLTDETEENPENARKSERILYVKLPYYGRVSTQFGRKLSKILSNNESNREIQVVYHTNKLKNFFSLKDRIPKLMQSTLVYEFQCQSETDSKYIGKTKRRLGQRINEHSKGKSAVKDHLDRCNNCKLSFEDKFKVLYKGRSDFEIQVVEALLITKKGPKLNKTLGSKGMSYFLNVFK